MSKVLSIASGKGGVGKTLLTASLGIVMAYKGYRVLLIDGDMGLRNMDLILGLENECFYNILDLAEGRCFMNDVKLSVSKNLDFIPAAQAETWDEIFPAAISVILDDAGDDYDFILLDCPAGVGSGIQFAADVSDKFMIVVAPSWASRRTADQAAQMIKPKVDFSYVMNQFSFSNQNQASFQEMLETIDSEYFSGVIPFSVEAARLAGHGNLKDLKLNGPFGKAVDYVYRSVIEGKEFPLSVWSKLIRGCDNEADEILNKSAGLVPVINKPGLSWNSGSQFYKWRRRR